MEQAAAVTVSACTALQALRNLGNVQSGQHVLVIGAGGGVGTFAVQIAKAFGAEVTGVCSTSKTDLVRSIGADDVIDYSREDFADGRQRYDLILDMAGSRSVSYIMRALTSRGILVAVGGEGGGRWFGGLGESLVWLARSPFMRRKFRLLMAAVSKEDLQTLKELIEAGKVRPVIDRTYPLSEVPEAVRSWARGHARGKVVITV
jgi:NADPH:quinone reductase-like Zn-dependent oxidoreductase